MEYNQKRDKKCSLKKHEEIDAASYCTKCEKFMCKKCDQFHSEFFDSKHDSFLIKSNNFETIKEINEIDPILMEENIKYLSEFSNDLKELNNKLKIKLEKIDKIKDDLQKNIQNIFTKIRNELNKIEDEYLMEIEKRYEKINLNKKIKENEILLNKIKLILKEGIIKNNLLINECKNIDIKNEEIHNYDKIFDIDIPKEEDINEIIEKIKRFNIIKENIINSSILKNDLKKQNQIDKWIKEKVNKNLIKYELIYKMTVNGSTARNFHKYCDNKGPTLTIIETNINEIFGGFTPLSWSKENDGKDKSKKTFLFSLNLMKKYDMFNRSKRAILYDEYCGPIFGESYDLYLRKNLLEGRINASKDSNFFEFQKLELLQEKGEKSSFETQEIEIFKVIYE